MPAGKAGAGPAAQREVPPEKEPTEDGRTHRPDEEVCDATRKALCEQDAFSMMGPLAGSFGIKRKERVAASPWTNSIRTGTAVRLTNSNVALTIPCGTCPTSQTSEVASKAGGGVSGRTAM